MAKRKIHLGPADGSAKALYVEGKAVDAFVPGELLKQTAAGLATSDIADSAFNSECIVAKEISESEGGDITTAYTVGDTAVGVVVRSGEFANVLVAASQNITTKGTALASNGAGALKIAATDGTDQVLFYSDEIVNTGGSAALVTVRKA
jgi:hypothetical protein